MNSIFYILLWVTQEVMMFNQIKKIIRVLNNAFFFYPIYFEILLKEKC